MIFLDLFAGIGGFALAAEWAGFQWNKHYFSEVDDYATRVYRRRFPDAVPLGDIRQIDGRALVADALQVRWGDRSEPRRMGTEENKEEGGRDQSATSTVYSSEAGCIISGGFPCQDISCAGKGAGLAGERSGLWFEYARLIGEIRPRYAIMENVGALTRRGLDRVLGSLAEIGYDAEWSDIRASDVGAPHRRERIWIVAYPEERGVRAGLREGGEGGERRGRSGDGGGEVPDADRAGLERWIECRECSGERLAWSNGEPYTGDWQSGAGIRRVSHGIPSRVDRLRCLGNAIVPQIAEMIFRQLKSNIKEAVK
jgi:DNA (cytosine-5)-methyltransferase 1